MTENAPGPHPDPTQPTPPQYAPPQYAPPAAPQYAAPQYAPPQAPPYDATYPGPAWALPAPGPGEPFDGARDPRDMTRPLYGATFGQAIARFFRGYAQFDGRASLSEMWFSRLFTALLLLAWLVMIPVVLALPTRTATDAAIAVFFVGVLATLALALPAIACSWRRLHDANFPGPLWFLTFAPFGDVAVLVLLLMRSRPEGRRFDVAVPAPGAHTGHWDPTPPQAQPGS
ncbi:DUF805 domain-containing protein [Leucobacter chromiireducens]|uniref:DUF805 domain-containing protein n=1 Tax=Leucobacter chromiireducens TaxID=283877 RepID=UPI000F63390F|nr:DUF805 domain-containing protein [Leucobacter chromiireducens]